MATRNYPEFESMKTTICILSFASFGALPFVSHAGDHDHHSAHTSSNNSAAIQGGTSDPIPALRILMPEAGATVGKQLAMVLETPGDLGKLTMGAPQAGLHLHVEADEAVLMPVSEQLIPLGNNRYVYIFDLPVAAGPHKLRVYWSDKNHRTIQSTIRAVAVKVEDR